MCLNVVIIGLTIAVAKASSAPSPLQVTIDCGSDENRSASKLKSGELFNSNPSYDVDSFCGLIHRAIPKTIEDGKFVLAESHSALDQIGFSDTPIQEAVAPPRGFIPKLDFPKPKISRIRPSKLNIPKLRPHGPVRAPKVGSPMIFHLRQALNEESSAERIERFKKGIQRMLHVVKFLGQFDQYLSERTRIIVDKLSKTFME